MKPKYIEKFWATKCPPEDQNVYAYIYIYTHVFMRMFAIVGHCHILLVSMCDEEFCENRRMALGFQRLAWKRKETGGRKEKIGFSVGPAGPSKVTETTKILCLQQTDRLYQWCDSAACLIWEMRQ